MIHQIVLGVQQCVVYLCANIEQSQSSVFYQNALMSMIHTTYKAQAGMGEAKGTSKRVLVHSGSRWVLTPPRGKVCHFPGPVPRNHLKMIRV